MESVYERLANKSQSLVVVGLGYVGLPLALAFAKKFRVYGFDICAERVKAINGRIDKNREATPDMFSDVDFRAVSSLEDIVPEPCFYIVTVPTPVDKEKKPDLSALMDASKSVGKKLRGGDYVVYESTVYPGCTANDCVPVLEENSELVYGRDFKVGYSPERINPGDREHTLTNTKKIVSACDGVALEEIAKVYSSIIEAGLYRAPSMEVAEASKVIENTQRDVNIALMNDISKLLSKMKINTYDVLEAASTKWNFMPFSPGLVGGHCIGVDPYYLAYRASCLNCDVSVLSAGRGVNEVMGVYVARELVMQLKKGSRVLVMGFSFKENVPDIRNTLVFDIVSYLQEHEMDVSVIDPIVSATEVFELYGVSIQERPMGKYNAVVLAVPHEQFLRISEADFQKFCVPNAVFADIKGVFRHKIKHLKYWSL